MNKNASSVFIKRIGAVVLASTLLLGTTASCGKADSKTKRDEVKEGAILHAFCWDFNTIKDNMEDIAASGFTAVQTSPINEVLDTHPALELLGEDGAWYYHYQPTDWTIGNYQLGTRDEFIAMCDEAEKYGISVIVDIVPNHTTPTKSEVSQNLIDAVGGIENLYHPENNGLSNYGNRFDCTRYDMGGLPDVDTENEDFQKYFFAYLQDCIACGADGFRIDTAKHIGLPDDDRPDGVENNFYTNMKETLSKDKDKVDYEDLFVYGEVLDDAGDRMASYQDMIGAATASEYGENIRSFLTMNYYNASMVAEYGLSRDTATDTIYEPDDDKIVTWVESHDTYYNDGESFHALDDEMVKLGWAIIASRKNGTPLFFNRPANSSRDNQLGDNKIGAAGNDQWKDDEIVAVNKFRLAMSGEDEILSNPEDSMKILIIERGNENLSKGCVIVNGEENESAIKVDTKLEDGEYTNMTDDNSIFNVKNGVLTGIAPARSVVVLMKE